MQKGAYTHMYRIYIYIHSTTLEPISPWMKVQALREREKRQQGSQHENGNPIRLQFNAICQWVRHSQRGHTARTHAHVYIESPCYVRALRKEYIRTHKKRNVYKKQAQPDMAPFCLLFHRRPKFSSLTGSGCLRLFLDANFLTAAAAAAVINKVHKGNCVERAMWKSEEENISMTAASAFEETDKFIECISAKNSIRIYLVGYIESLLSPLPTC